MRDVENVEIKTMSKNLRIITVQPDSMAFWWTVATQLHNFRKYGLSDKYTAIIFLPFDRLGDGFNGKWKFLESKFPEANFFYIKDINNMTRTATAVAYVPLLRPYSLYKYFQLHPELKNDAILYLDSDVILSKPLSIDHLIDDDVNYMSYTGNREKQYNYNCADHFFDKEKNIKEEMWGEYEKKDVLNTLTTWFGFDKQYFIDNKHRVGGAQYLLKNVDAAFFNEVYDGIIMIRTFLANLNQKYMKGNTPKEKEDNGWQSWCSDMWSLQFTLWKYGLPTECPEEMDFIWATDKIDRWGKHAFYHDAGGTHNIMKDDEGNEHRLFHKRGEIIEEKVGNEVRKKAVYMLPWEDDKLRSPFMDDLSWVSKQYCSSKYVEEIMDTKKYLMS